MRAVISGLPAVALVVAFVACSNNGPGGEPREPDDERRRLVLPDGC